MAEKTKIEWCDHTFNPWSGCTKVSAGCANCYAESLAKRAPKTFGGWGKGVPRKRTSEAYWRQPLRWNRAGAEAVDDALHDFGEDRYIAPPRPRVFCASMADWLDPEVPIEWLADLLDLIRRTPHLDWLLLTKRPELWAERMRAVRRYMSRADGESEWTPPASDAFVTVDAWLDGTPPSNVWIGTTVESQEQVDKRIPALLGIPAEVRFLSCEPLLGPVDLDEWVDGVFMDASIKPLSGYVSSDGFYEPWTSNRHRIHWVICGGESGPNARAMELVWAESLRDQCRSAGCAFFMKQMGGIRKPFPEIPANLLIRQFPEVRRA